MHSYDDPFRPTLVLIWADGTIRLDEWNDDPEVDAPLAAYLHYYNTLPVSPGEVPTAVYAMCKFCGKLHECRIERTREEVQDDWIWRYYEVIAMVPSANPIPGPHTPSVISEQRIINLAIRIDGRA